MIENSIAGLKLAAPKLITGHFIGLPATLVVGTTFGLAAVAVLGAACVGGYFLAARSVTKDSEITGELAASIPPV
jgi:hypothetical protein